MQNKQNHKHIDKVLQEKFSNFEDLPPAFVLDEVLNAVNHQKSKSKKLIFWWAAAILLFSGGVFWLFSLNYNQSNVLTLTQIDQKTNKFNNQSSVHVDDKSSESNNFVSSINSNLAGKQEKIPSNENKKTNEKTTQAPKVNHNKKQEKPKLFERGSALFGPITSIDSFKTLFEPNALEILVALQATNLPTQLASDPLIADFSEVDLIEVDDNQIFPINSIVKEWSQKAVEHLNSQLPTNFLIKRSIHSDSTQDHNRFRLAFGDYAISGTRNNKN